MPRRQPVDSYYSLELNERKVNENDTLSSNSTTSMPLLPLPPPSEASSGISAEEGADAEEANQEGSFGGDDDGGDTDAATASISASHPQDAFVEVAPAPSPVPARSSTTASTSSGTCAASSGGGPSSGNGSGADGGAGANNRDLDNDSSKVDASGTGHERETTTDNNRGEEETAEEGEHDQACAAENDSPKDAYRYAGAATAAAAAAAAPTTVPPPELDINQRREKLRSMGQINESSVEEGEEKTEEQAVRGDGTGGGEGTAPPPHEGDDTYALNEPPILADGRSMIVRRVPSLPGAYHVQPLLPPSLRVSSSRTGSRRTSHSHSPSRPLAEEGDIELADIREGGGTNSADEDDGVSAMTETQFDSVARMTVATPLEAHTYVEAIEVIPEEPDAFLKGIMKRRNILLVVVAVILALAIGIGVGVGRGAGGGKVIMPRTSVSNVPFVNSSKLVELNVTFVSALSPVSRSWHPNWHQMESDPDSVLLGLGASALVKGSPSASMGGLVQVFDLTPSKPGTKALVYNETLRTSPFTTQLPRGVVPEEVMVGPSFDSSGRIVNVAISFLGKGGSPGFVRIFERENGKGVLPNGKEWWQVGQDVGLGLVNDFIDVQSDGFASGYGASVGYSANVNGHLIVGSDAGFARLYFLQQNSDASRWVRIDANRLTSSNESSTDNPVIVASRNYRFAVAYPREGAGTVSLFETFDPRTGEPLDLDRNPLEPPLVPGFRQIGQTLKGLATGDGFGRSLSMDIRGDVLIVGCESGGYVQSFRFNEEASKVEQFGHTIVGDAEDEGSFGRSLTLGYFPANAGSCPTCIFQLDGLRMIVGSPSYNSTRGRAIVFEYSDSDSEWKRFPSLLGNSDTHKFGHSVSLSIEQSTVAVTYDHTDEGENTGSGTRMWRIMGQ